MTRLEQAALRKDRRDPYHTLIAAILHQAVVDARSRPTHRPVEDGCSPADAVTFLRDPERIAYFCGLVDCDGTKVQPALLKAAKLRGTVA